jgi:uncharacterized protein
MTPVKNGLCDDGAPESLAPVDASSVKRRRDDCDTSDSPNSELLGSPTGPESRLLDCSFVDQHELGETSSIESDCCARVVSKLPKRDDRCESSVAQLQNRTSHQCPLPYATTIKDYLQAGGSNRYRPRPEWLFHLSSQDCASHNLDSTDPRLEQGETASGEAVCAEPMALDKRTVFGRDWDSVLHMAIRENATEASLAIIDMASSSPFPTSKGASDVVLEAINAKGVTPLILAAQKGNMAVVRALLCCGVNPAAASFNGTTAALQAAHFGHAGILDLLLRAAGSDASGGGNNIIEAANANHTTPLMRAAQEGHEEAVRLLLRSGAAVNRRNRVHLTALMLSAQRGHAHVCRLLIQAGADINAATDDQQSTALLLACKRGHINVVRTLVTAGCDLWGTDRRGRTAQQIVMQQQRRRGATALSDGTGSESTAGLVDLLEPETQVALMQETSRRKRNWEILRLWTLLQHDRANVAIFDAVGISIERVLQLLDLNSSARFENSSTQALIRTMALPAPLVETIAQFMPRPKLWSNRLSMIQSTCLANSNAGVAITLDFTDEVLEESGFLEACDVAKVPAPSPFHNWQLWKVGQSVGGSSTSPPAGVGGSAPGPLLVPSPSFRVTEATNPRPRDAAHPTRIELRRQIGYLRLLSKYYRSLGMEVLAEPPYCMPQPLLQQLCRVADLESLSRRMQGHGVHFNAQVATDLMLLARRLTAWHHSRERHSERCEIGGIHRREFSYGRA